MQPILDPRAGDIEDDASSTKRRSLLSLAGALLGEISFPKLAIAWMMLIGFPGLILGVAPLLISLWIASVSSHAAVIYTEVLPALVLLALAVLGWFAWQPLLRLAESSFWSLNALAVQPAYIAFREGFRHLAERLLASWMNEDRRPARAGAVRFLPRLRTPPGRDRADNPLKLSGAAAISGTLHPQATADFPRFFASILRQRLCAIQNA